MFFFAKKAFDTIGGEVLVEDEDYDDLEDLFDADILELIAKYLDST